MRRRHFLAGIGAAILLGCAPTAAPAETPFEPTRFTVEVKGSGPDVILIPGLTAGPDVWAGTVTSVPGYRYHLVHIGGMAGAPVGGNASGNVVAPVADELLRYIDTRNLRPSLIGHSMGGTVAMMIAARQPNLVGRLMVVDMLPQPAGLFGSSAGRLGPLANSLRDIANTAGGRRLFDNLVRNFGPPDSAPSDSGVVSRAMHELASTDLTPELGRITAPMTVVYAPQDAAAPRFYSGSYASARGARFVRIDGSGHMIMLDQPQRFHTAVREFLRR